VEATKLLKDAGFKLNYHLKPGLPGSTPRRDFEMFKILFTNPAFQPDMLKIYPTVVLKDSDLYKLWKKQIDEKNKIIHLPATANKCITQKIPDYKPLTDKQFEKLVLKIKNEAIPPYVRIARLVRDVPTQSIVAGPVVSNLRQIIAPKSNCPCIRCREVRGDYVIKEKIILDRIDYDASDGREIFLQYVSPDKKKLFALLRLRIPKAQPSVFRRLSLRVLENAAIVREVHTYGKLAKISTKDKASPQHIGLGKKLLLEAERIAKKEFGLDKIVVISGVGVRGYYRKAGYRLRDTYMVKSI